MIRSLSNSQSSRCALKVIGLALTLMSSARLSIAADWPMRGLNFTRNAVIPNATGPVNWSLPDRDGDSKNIRWHIKVAGHTGADPVVSNGLVWIGLNLWYPHDPQREEDSSVLACFDEKSGQLLYQYVSPRLPERRPQDWPSTPQCGSPLIEKDRLWFCNNRCEVICLDIAPLLARSGEPKVVWKVDLRAQFSVYPVVAMISRNITHCSVAVYQDFIYVNTTNGKDYRGIPAPDAPSLICFDKHTGVAKWQDNSPGNQILDVQHGSPLVANINGQPQVIMGQGDGWIRSFDALTGKLLWKFDFAEKKIKRGPKVLINRVNNLVAMPVLYEGRIYFACGHDYEYGVSQGRLCCIDPAKRGDLSRVLIDDQGQVAANLNSGLVWEYLGKSNELSEALRCTLTSVVVHKGLVFVTDIEGLFHCVDAHTGKGVWIHSLEGDGLGSPLIVGDKIYATSNTRLAIFKVSRDRELITSYDSNDYIESGLTFANGTLYLMTRNKLFAIQ